MSIFVQERKFNGLEANMSYLLRLTDAKSRSISPSNFTSGKGKGGMATKGTGNEATRELLLSSRDVLKINYTEGV
jgi:hypothetical protein